MPVVKLPDGTLVQLPDAPAAGTSIFPEWLQDAAKYGPGFLKESGKAVLRGGLNTLASAGEAAGNLAGEGMRSPNVTNSPKPQAEIDKALPDDLGDSTIYRRGLEGMGGAAALPVPGVGITRQLLSGLAGGMGGGAGRKAAEATFPNSPGIQVGADIAGGLAAGAGSAFGIGPKQTQGQREVRQASAGLTPADFSQAEQNAAQAQQAGAKTATAAEMFPPGSGVMALASKTRAMGSDNPLRVQTANRPEDITNLSNEFLNRIHPLPVDPNTVANNAAGAANGALTETKNIRGTALSNQLSGQNVPFRDIENLHANLNTVAQGQMRPGAGDAYRAVANALLDQTGQPITNLQQLSLAIKGLKTAAKNPNSPVFSGGQIDAVDLSHAIQAAEAQLGNISPAFRTGMEDFRNFSRQVVTPERQGPIGSVADRNPLLAGQTPVSRLEGMLSGNSPQTVEGTARTLGSPVMTGGNEVNPLEIARALAQKKLNTGSMDPGNAVRGTEGSGSQQQFEALLRAGGNAPGNTMTPLAVADRLQPFLNPASMNDVPKMGLGQALLRPFRTMDMAITGHRLTGLNEEVGRLLADPSPANIRRLQEISMFDPSVRRMFSAKSGLMSGLTGEEK